MRYQVNEKNWERDDRFTSQIRAASLSVPSHIVEGDESGTNKNSGRYFYMTKASVGEVVTQSVVASEIGYMDTEVSEALVERYDHMSAMLRKLISARR